MLSKSANSIYAINFEVRPLHFETLRLSATTTLLEFATLGDGIRLLVLVRAYRKNEHGQTKGQNNDIPMPKCLYASREVLTPLNNTVLAPVGDRRASWSRVSASPPALMIRSLAAWVKRRAATVIFGTVVRRISSVTVPTWTITFELRSGVLEVSLTIRERERGGRLFLERKRRWRITWLGRKKHFSGFTLRLEILNGPCWSSNRYDGRGNGKANDNKDFSYGIYKSKGSRTFTRRSRYGSSLFGAVRLPFLTWWAVISIPYIWLWVLSLWIETTTSSPSWLLPDYDLYC